MTVKMISVTPDAEKLISFIARVSSDNQDNPEYEKLLAYCLKKGHFSVFEMADLTVEIQTTRDISAQILRHKSFSFSEFSQRYQVVSDPIELADTRLQDAKNRQNSLECENPATKALWLQIQDETYSACMAAYQAALSLGIAKELARKVLPLQAPTRLYVKGSIRSWIHYCSVRCDSSTQKEHRDIARDVWSIVRREMATLACAAEQVYPTLRGEE